MSKVVWAASKADARYVFMGVFFNPIGTKNFDLVASDGSMLALSKLECQSTIPKTLKPFILPLEGINLLKSLGKTLAKSKIDNLSMHQIKGSNKIIFKAGDYILVSTVIDGKFPDWKQVIPQEKESISFKIDEKAKSVLEMLYGMKLSKHHSNMIVLSVKNKKLFAESTHHENSIDFDGEILISDKI